MSLENIKELMEEGKMIYIDQYTDEIIPLKAEDLNEDDRYSVVGTAHGVANYKVGTYSLWELDDLLKSEPHITYSLSPEGL